MAEFEFSNVLAGLSAGIALASSVYTLVMGIRYDKSVKKMDEAIKKFQLSEYRKQEEESKKAKLRAEVFHIGNEWKVSIINEGKGQARNVRIQSEDLNVEEGGIYIFNGPIVPYPVLNTNDRFYLDLALAEFRNIKPTMNIIWDDDSGSDRSVFQALCLC